MRGSSEASSIYSQKSQKSQATRSERDSINLSQVGKALLMEKADYSFFLVDGDF